MFEDVQHVFILRQWLLQKPSHGRLLLTNLACLLHGFCLNLPSRLLGSTLAALRRPPQLITKGSAFHRYTAFPVLLHTVMVNTLCCHLKKLATKYVIGKEVLSVRLIAYKGVEQQEVLSVRLIAYKGVEQHVLS